MQTELIRGASRRVRKFSIAALVSAMMLVALVPGALAGAAPVPIVFDYLQIGTQCVYGTAPSGATVELTWKSAGGAVKLHETQVASDSGSLYYCSTNPSTVLAIGDRLKAESGSVTHQLVIPELTIRVNRAADSLKGRGPAGATLRVECWGGPLPSFEPCQWHRLVVASSEGKWSKLVPWDIIGGEGFAIRWKSAGGDFVYAGGIARYVTVTLGESRFSGATNAGQTANVALEDATTHEVLATANPTGAPPVGRFTARFKDVHGNRVPVAAGYELITDVAPGADMIVPDIEATASAATNIVSGRCFDTGRFDGTVFIHLFRSGHERGWVLEGTDEEGNFTIDFMEDGFRDPANVKVGDRLLVMCMQTEGDWVQRNIVAGE